MVVFLYRGLWFVRMEGKKGVGLGYTHKQVPTYIHTIYDRHYYIKSDI